MIPTDEYQIIIKQIPILCVDLIIRNQSGEFLLVKRNNEPLKGEWWVVGGRVLKGESIETAAIRKIKEELSLRVQKVNPVGYFEATAQKHPFGLPLQYHAVSIVLSTTIDAGQPIQIDSQSNEWKFFDELPVDFIVIPFSSS